MREVLKVCDMKNSKDVSKVRQAIANSEGVLACQIDKPSGKVEIVYDGQLASIDDIIESIENVGYTVI